MNPTRYNVHHLKKQFILFGDGITSINQKEISIQGMKSMFSLKIIALTEQYDALVTACDSFAEAVHQDSQLPLCLPSHPLEEGPPRQAAISSIIDLWRAPPHTYRVEAGIICASPETIQKAMGLNHIKDTFQEAIKAIREMVTGEKTRLDKLIDRVLQQEGRRTEELTLALKRINLSQLDLLRCYAKVRILPKNLKSLSWTWAKTHSSIVQVTKEEAIEMAHNLPNTETKAIVLSLLNQITPNERLAMKKKLPNQLRANLVWEEDKLLKRQAITLSGVALSQDQHLPRTIWRENPAEQQAPLPERLIRFDTEIEPEPFIKALH